MNKFLIRCSSLSSIMADPVSYPRDEMKEAELSALASKKRTPEQVAMLDAVMARTLSAGAQSHVHDLVRRHLYDYQQPELNTRPIKKGNAMEGAALSLLSVVTGDMVTKNERTFYSGALCGTPDAICAPIVYDTKVPETIETFPIVRSIAEKMATASGYVWQLRGYMLLCNDAGIPLETGKVAYCLLPTPDDLIAPWDDKELHELPHPLVLNNPERCVTMATITRDLAIEARIRIKVEAAQLYANQLIEQFLEEHKG